MLDWSKIKPYPYSAGFKEKGGTSQEAAARVNPKLGKLHQQVMAAMSYFPRGATPDELADFTGIDRQTVASRFTELTNKGYLNKTKRRGKTVKGGACAIWEACEINGQVECQPSEYVLEKLKEIDELLGEAV